ncbi:MAG: GNAT family N-acetyltransferase, partial [Proteobacteria bacterium]
MIRPVQFADAASIYDVIVRAKNASSVPTGPTWSLEQVAEECRGVGLIFEQTKEGSEPAVRAFILYRDTGAAWEISFLATDPEFQGQGFMKSLLEYMREERPNERQIWLEVHTDNVKARRLYEQQGLE